MPKELNALQAGTVQSNTVNQPTVRTYQGKNQFPQSFIHPSTCSYGVVDPVCAAKCEPGDIYNYKFVTDLNTFTLKSPLKSKVNKYTAAFKVPMYSLYPRNWDIMLPIPNKGSDVPEETRAIFNIRRYVVNLLQGYNQAAASESGFQYAIRFVFLLEHIFSDGGIFAKFNMHFNHYLFKIADDGLPVCFDDWFDTHFIPQLKEYFKRLKGTNPNAYHLNHYGENEGIPDYIVSFDPKDYGQRVTYLPSSATPTYYISFERAVELLRTGEYRMFNDTTATGSETAFPQCIMHSPNNFIQDLNIEPIISYQLACAHFFNNPKIDYIYSAQLYRDNMESLQMLSGRFGAAFTWNGIQKLYDVFSSKQINSDQMINFVNITSYTTTFYLTSFWFNLFNYQRSLRYGDYFTGAHPEPLAVGDINTPVVSNSVNALDMTRKIQLTRLLNKVNISGPRIQDYIKSVFGGALPEAEKDSPVRLSLEQFEVSGFEVNNTGSDQLSTDSPNITTTNLRLDDSRYMFEAAINEPCYIIVVQYFDAHRIYSKTLDRFSFHRSRYDDFIPDLQFDGDQPLYQMELDAVSGSSTDNFAYNLRYMEYKQRYSYASGGFIRRLPSWAFITDNTDGNPVNEHINPDYIRSSPSEFDRFYKSLSGYSLGSRFHFITFNTNVAAPYRQMVYAPEILA